MGFIRILITLLLLAALVCFGIYLVTGQLHWRQRGVLIVKWVVIAGLGFFAVIMFERFRPV
jgi:uncharacterized membrane protein YccC